MKTRSGARVAAQHPEGGAAVDVAGAAEPVHHDASAAIAASVSQSFAKSLDDVGRKTRLSNAIASKAGIEFGDAVVAHAAAGEGDGDRVARVVKATATLIDTATPLMHALFVAVGQTVDEAAQRQAIVVQELTDFVNQHVLATRGDDALNLRWQQALAALGQHDAFMWVGSVPSSTNKPWALAMAQHLGGAPAAAVFGSATAVNNVARNAASPPRQPIDRHVRRALR